MLQVIAILLLIIIVQLAIINSKLPGHERDYVAEALERDRDRRAKNDE